MAVNVMLRGRRILSWVAVALIAIGCPGCGSLLAYFTAKFLASSGSISRSDGGTK